MLTNVVLFYFLYKLPVLTTEHVGMCFRHASIIYLTPRFSMSTSVHLLSCILSFTDIRFTLCSGQLS